MRLIDGIYEEVVDDAADVARGLTASSAPMFPPQAWFEKPDLDRATPITITADGRVFGHIADWSGDHIGLPPGTKPPRSAHDYAFFKTGTIKTAEGAEVPIGNLTLAGGHAPLNASAGDAVEHYDNTASAIADIAVGEDQYGIWVAGGLRPGVDEGQIRALRASAPSGDWRPINGNLELVAVCQVNTPGFPIARTMVASGEMISLVACGAGVMYELQQERGVFDAMRVLQDRLGTLESTMVAAGFKKKDDEPEDDESEDQPEAEADEPDDDEDKPKPKPGLPGAPAKKKALTAGVRKVNSDAGVRRYGLPKGTPLDGRGKKKALAKIGTPKATPPVRLHELINAPGLQASEIKNMSPEHAAKLESQARAKADKLSPNGDAHWEHKEIADKLRAHHKANASSRSDEPDDSDLAKNKHKDLDQADVVNDAARAPLPSRRPVKKVAPRKAGPRPGQTRRSKPVRDLDQSDVQNDADRAEAASKLSEPAFEKWAEDAGWPTDPKNIAAARKAYKSSQASNKKLDAQSAKRAKFTPEQHAAEADKTDLRSLRNGPTDLSRNTIKNMSPSRASSLASQAKSARDKLSPDSLSHGELDDLHKLLSAQAGKDSFEGPGGKKYTAAPGNDDGENDPPQPNFSKMSDDDLKKHGDKIFEMTGNREFRDAEEERIGQEWERRNKAARTPKDDAWDEYVKKHPGANASEESQAIHDQRFQNEWKAKNPPASKSLPAKKATPRQLAKENPLSIYSSIDETAASLKNRQITELRNARAEANVRLRTSQVGGNSMDAKSRAQVRRTVKMLTNEINRRAKKKK